MPPTDMNQRELDSLSDEERAAIEGEDIGSEADVAAAAKAAESIKDDPSDGLDPAAAAASAAEPAPDADPEPIAPRLLPPADLPDDAALNALLDQRKAIREQYRNGDISAEEKDNLEDEINEKISDIRTARNTAQFVDNFNTQMAEQEYLRTLAAVKADIKRTDGVDYDKNSTLLTSWDIKVRTIASDPANAGQSGEWVLREAHKQVMAEATAAAEAMGFKRPAGSGQPPDPAVRRALEGRRPSNDLPHSLSTLPSAAADNPAAGAEFAHLDNLSGDDLEIAVARMTPDQQERWARA